MDTAIVTAMAGVLGSLVGGSASVATTWVTQRALTANGNWFAPRSGGAKLFTASSSSEYSARIIDSFERTLEKPETLLHAYALLNGKREDPSTSDAVLAQGEATLRFITEQYFSPNLSVEEMSKLVRKWTTDPTRAIRRSVPSRT